MKQTKTKIYLTAPADLAPALAELRTLEAKLNEAAATMERELDAVKIIHASRVADELKRHRQLTKACLEYLGENAAKVLPPEAKSVEISGCVVGLRKNPPKVVLLQKKDEWVLAALRLDRHPVGKLYVRQAAPEVNKEALIEHRSIVGEWLPKLGLDIVQEEKPFIDTQLGAEKPAEE